MSVNIKGRPITNDKGQVLNDLELIEQSIADIEDYEKRTNKPAPVDPHFKQFLYECKEACKTPEDVVKYKKAHVLQTMDYDMVCARTEKINSKLKDKEAI